MKSIIIINTISILVDTMKQPTDSPRLTTRGLRQLAHTAEVF